METVLNIESFNPNFQSGLVFTLFEGLKAGESFRILTSTYPEPIKEQFLGTKLQNFKFEAQQLKNGHWETRIAKHDPRERANANHCGCGEHKNGAPRHKE